MSGWWRRVELANLALTIACNFEEVFGSLNRFFFRLCLDQREASDDLFRFSGGAVGQTLFLAGAPDTSAKRAGQAAFGRQKPSGLKASWMSFPISSISFWVGGVRSGLADLCKHKNRRGSFSFFKFSWFSTC